MTDIPAAIVVKLRKMSGQGMMDCKKALLETEGDLDKAMELLRKKGLATLAKRAGREVSEGIVVGQTKDDSKLGILATLCCETDFVAKSDDFVAASELLVDFACACDQDTDAQNIHETEIDGKKFSDIITETVSKTGEKMEVGDFTRYNVQGSGFTNIYIHFNKKLGTMLEIETSDDNIASSETLRQAANDIAMHITAIKPLALDTDGIDQDTIEREKAIYAEQVTGKPENIIEKIVEGKMRKFYAENCLLKQPFVKDDSKTVEQVINEAAKQAGGEAKIKRFVRYELG
ncbi:MAG: translation elongation factor Ts [Planctomycetota bacterium]|jgi:elongation factor Ts